MARLTGRQWHPPLAWTVCEGRFGGTPTGYRKHIENRNKIGRDGRRIGHRHVICDACRYAIAVHHADYKKRRILNGAKTDKGQGYVLQGGAIFQDSTGTQRRLQALATLGYGWNELGRRLGVSGTSIGSQAIKRRVIYPATLVKIKNIYNELSMLPAEKTRTSKVTMTRAKAKGWLPPLYWDDEVIDNPYGLPSGMDERTLWTWFWNCATMIERIEWCLENGGVPEAPPRDRSKRERTRRTVTTRSCTPPEPASTATSIRTGRSIERSPTSPSRMR